MSTKASQTLQGSTAGCLGLLIPTAQEVNLPRREQVEQQNSRLQTAVATALCALTHGRPGAAQVRRGAPAGGCAARSGSLERALTKLALCPPAEPH